MSRAVRYQGAIIRDDHILLIRHCEHATGHSYWLLPGGGREAGETEEACVRREMLEETNLQVTVERLLLDETGIPLGAYKRLKTYLCRVAAGDAQPGYEPEVEAARQYSIAEVRWFDLRHPDEWDPQLKVGSFTHSLLQRIRAVLGYPVAG
jgi:ADP-ribose pyrophosphatase YjhB (NUDIX family)